MEAFDPEHKRVNKKKKKKKGSAKSLLLRAIDPI